MIDTLLKVVPLLFILFLGYGLKRIRILSASDGGLLLKLVFYIIAPALILQSITTLPLTPTLLYLPLIAILISLLNAAFAFFLGNILRLPKKMLGVFIIAAMIMNDQFVLPFFLSFHGNQEIGKFLLFDLGNSIMTFSIAYYLGCFYGENKTNARVIFKKIIFAPPLWAIVIALISNMIHVHYPPVISNFLGLLSNMIIPLVMLALGCFLSFSQEIKQLPKIAITLCLRFGVGLLLGLFFVHVFHLQGLPKIIVIVCSAAPIAYTTLTYSSLENLDTEFAAAVVSLGILTSIVLTPILLVSFK